MGRGTQFKYMSCPAQVHLVRRVAWRGRYNKVRCQHDPELCLSLVDNIDDVVCARRRRVQEVACQFETVSESVHYNLDECFPVNATRGTPGHGHGCLDVGLHCQQVCVGYVL